MVFEDRVAGTPLMICSALPRLLSLSLTLFSQSVRLLVLYDSVQILSCVCVCVCACVCVSSLAFLGSFLLFTPEQLDVFTICAYLYLCLSLTKLHIFKTTTKHLLYFAKGINCSDITEATAFLPLNALCTHRL